MAVVRRLRPLLGTLVAIDATAPEAPLTAVESAFGAVANVDRLMHPRRGGSDIAAINRAPCGKVVRVDPCTWQLLALSRHLAGLTDGLFDPCLPAAPGRIGDVELPEVGSVRCRQRVALDLGGIAKGYAVDCAVAALRAAGCTDGTVNAGGDLRVFGAPQRIWVRRGQRAVPIELTDAACAVSDPAEPQRPAEHRGYYGRAGVAVSQAVAVVAPSAAVADAMTKCALFADAATLDGWLAGLGARLVAAEIDAATV